VSIKKIFNLIFILSLILVPFFYNSCAGKHDEGSLNLSSTKGICDAILKAEFETGYWPFVRDVRACVGCHATGPGSGFFANSNLDLAYDAFKAKGEATIASYATDKAVHAKGNKTGEQFHIDTVALLRPKWTAAQAAYNECAIANANHDDDDTDNPEIVVPSKFTIKKSYTTAPIVPPANTSATVTMSWDLGTQMEKAADNVAGLTFEMILTAQDLGSGNTQYSFNNPRLINASASAAYIKGIAVKVNGVLIPKGSAFYNVERYVPNVAQNNTRQLTRSLGGAIFFISPIDKPIDVQVGFIKVGAADITFQPLTLQQLNAAGGIFAVNCAGCHGASGGFSVANVNNMVGAYGTSLVTLVTPYVLGKSYIYGSINNYPVENPTYNTDPAMTADNKGASPMPVAGIMSQADRDRVRDWILDGAPAAAANIRR
jgi:mono/diheme cytochrome c family protein